MKTHGFSVTIRPGQTMTDGLEVLDLHGDEPAKITNVSVVGGGAALRFLGAQIAGPQRRWAQWVGATPEFKAYPPEAWYIVGTYRPAVGAIIQPYARTHRWGYELLIGYRFISDKVAARTAIRISYTVAGRDYVLTDPAQLVTCPSGSSNIRCGQIANRIFPDG